MHLPAARKPARRTLRPGHPTRGSLGPALLTLLVAGCGGSSGGGGGPALPPPTIVAASYTGAGPVAGDQLILVMSQDVSLNGAILDDADLTLTSGTLGAVSAAPALVTGSARAVQITLGAGVSFTPGVTTAVFSAGNDAVRGVTGVVAGGSPILITAGDGDNPTISNITLNQIETALNGNPPVTTGIPPPAGGRLQVPPNGFTIDLDHTDPTSPFNGSATVVTASVVVTTPAGAVAAGANLASWLSITTNMSGSTICVPASVIFPVADITVTVVVVDATGMVSNPASFTFRVANRNNAILPFESSPNAQQVWYLDISRDVESYTHNAMAFNPVAVAQGADGRGDLEDLFCIVGLYGTDPNVNATVLSRIRTTILSELGTLYTGANVSFTFTAPGSFPAGQSSVPYANAGFSQICIAGAESPAGTSGVLGVAIFDENNETQNNDCLVNFAGSQRLGVFIHTLVNGGLRPMAPFRATFAPFTPGLPVPGTPIGNDPDDAARLAGTFMGSPTRTTQINTAIQEMARAIAVITAHECGHSVGLVADGAMPSGLYGGVALFGGSQAHIVNTSFTAPAQNVMNPFISFEGAVDPGTMFNTLNLSYLRQTALYNN